MKKYNFNPGPSTLPQETVNNTAKAVVNFSDTGLSLMEISHRSKDFQLVLNKTIMLFKELLNIPNDYSILFLGGGASLQFCMVPYNLLETKAAYLNSGAWACKAIEEAKLFGEVLELASSREKNFSYIPKNYIIPSDVDYFHITTNNTIFGTEIHSDIESSVPIVADMSSDIFSRTIDVSKYGLIYGGAQKNLAPAGVTFVIIKNSILGKVSRSIPSMLNYSIHIENGSMFNTPPVIPIYAALQTLKWLKSLGGIEEIHKRNKEKADLLYEEIDRNRLFKGTAAIEDRSLMNVCFIMNDEYKNLENDFQQFATSKGIVGIKGHRSVGGFRASIYNAIPKSTVKVLIHAMQKFERMN
ncbi:MAG: 3-phosphoserine/phosphohydroxythreonine transaminase [Bacteroidales bacterium OttesenSCG-928-I14]|jgi:phosphoserine aminotransferase|nr:3-phosphoserine/phosphohydroxythreonine transaminase [Bacteroidales bacterium OttesenSCG-928-I14]